ncbi:MAG: ATP-binding protein [Chromatiaceae bacterium]|nr:ATP-binding protein [Chromatiaceae bacterium]
MTQNYTTEIELPRHDASLGAVQALFANLCGSLGVPDPIRREVELALEEGLINFFKHAIPEGVDTPVRLRIEFHDEAIRLVARAAGRPFDFARLPHYQAPRSLEETPQGLGTFLIERAMDSVKWRYLEKEGQEFEMVKRLPAPLVPGHGNAALRPDRRQVQIQGEISYRRLQTAEEALALASAAWDLYGYGYKDVIYYPDRVLEQSRTGQLLSWIAIDEAGTVIGHYAMMRHRPEDPLGEMGAAFVLPEARKGGIFRRLSDRLHADAAQSGVRALYSLSVTHHVATQKASEALGRITVGLRLASSPAVFVEGARPGDRITTTFNYHQVVPRACRTIYPPRRHREMIRQGYDWLGLSVTEADPSAQVPSGHDDFLECHRDLTWNRALIEAAGGEAVHYKLAAFTAFLVEQGIACILLSIDLEDPGAPALTAAAEALGYFYSGIFPESGRKGHDVLELQFLNGITLDPSQIQLHQPSAKAILAYILALGPPCLAALASAEAGEGAR